MTAGNPITTRAFALLALPLALLFAGCGGGSGGGGLTPTPPPVVPQTPPGDPGLVVGAYDPLPGVVATAVGTSGGSGPGGRFLPGDLVTVQFTLKSTAGDTLDLTLFNAASAYISGPTHNYNRVIKSQSNVRAASIYLGNATWQYTFPVPLPAVFEAPYNDTASFGTLEGELTGQPLHDGTYTIGIELSTLYEVDYESKRDAGALLVDILVGSGATTIEPRAVVADQNCNQCHTDVIAHGGRRKGVGLCVLCHTSGAEDRNDALVEGGTPGVSIDFRVMIHKIHNGHHLPSVLGITTKLDGSGKREYLPTGTPYKLVGFNVLDASHIGFPVFPSLTTAMPRDFGYSALTTAAKALDDEMRQGVVACAKCHGDPDGTAGPMTAPAQGNLHETQPSRHACGSCHDDIVWSQPYYIDDNTIMPANPGTCSGCHPASSTTPGAWPVREGHLHPLVNPAFNPGLSFNVSAVSEAGAHNGDGNIDPGEKVQVTMTCTNDDGSPVLPSTVSSINCVIAGPTSNYNLLLSTSVPVTHPGLAGAGPYTFNVPSQNVLELVGTNTVGATDVFPATLRTPHLNLAAAPTVVRSRGANPGGGGNSTSVSALAALQNYIDVVSVTGFNGQVAAPAVTEFICVEDGLANREYVQVKWVQGNRLWLNTPLRNAHPAGSTVVEVTLTTRTVTSNWTLTAASGVISEVGTTFGTDGDVLVDYWSDYVVPSVYPPPLNDSPGLGEEVGEWQGKVLADGTYSLDIYGVVNRTLNLQGETNSYRGTSVAGLKDFRVGSPGDIEPYTIISEAENCYACHDDVWFHGGGRRSFETCIMCHGDAGAEDRARYTSPNGAETPGVSVSFREMLHKIHMGRDLTNAATYTVVGNGGTPHTYEHVGYPALPGGVMQCVKCHGNDAWHEPQNRDHPTQQVVPVRSWKFVCGACHDSAAAQAHIDVNTAPSGVESCAVCHGELREKDVVRVHYPR